MLDGIAMDALDKALQIADLRQQVYANNIANVNTPGYKTEHVTFSNVLNQSSQLMQQKYIPISSDTANLNVSSFLQSNPVITTSNTSIENNGNNVSLDSQMAKMAANAIRYNALVQDMQMRFQRLQTAINGG
ncbi:flagellar basal body rod protein FlgB [Alicyclobacillus tolerans]|uniref:Flagellar basal body rod protein FlgB n=2 Tax=Alicyclobacillus tolerans TaxID=90970 RepID=A0ABT9LX66_9BACL|nr:MULTISPECIES: flagellar basal body rod protein FlgB [Alicyclobacillus]MDP9728839.1 flagellar basal-body rod protein FlgB [Alicyclobacillus tengchongensis]SHK35069.1 flagellar basal-body rod protein FlgB [Alicyclobacillus montanus]